MRNLRSIDRDAAPRFLFAASRRYRARRRPARLVRAGRQARELRIQVASARVVQALRRDSLNATAHADAKPASVTMGPLLRRTAGALVSLQIGPRAAGLDELPGDLRRRIVTPLPQHADYCGTACLVSALDEVLTVDTSVAHVAGIVAVGGLVIKRAAPEWRWMECDARSLCYPHLRDRADRAVHDDNAAPFALKFRAASMESSRMVSGMCRSRTAYVGTYGPKGEGIYRFRQDGETGALTLLGLAAKAANPSRFVIDCSQRFLYAVSEIDELDGVPTGSVSAYSIDADGELGLLNVVPSCGACPTHLSLHPGGAHLLVANYMSGTVAVIPVRDDGGLLESSDVTGTSRRDGTAAASGPSRPHAHMIESDHGGDFVFATDLGLDRTTVWRFDAQLGRLSKPTSIVARAGAGPRHFVLHPNGRWFYLINERASTVVFMHYEAETGSLTPKTEVRTLPSGFSGTSFASDIVLSRDGRLLYALNRLHDSVAIFSLRADGEPMWMGEEWTRGSYPRSACLDPDGRFMYVCNQRSDHVAVFRVQGASLNFTGQYAAVGSPAMIAFLRA